LTFHRRARNSSQCLTVASDLSDTVDVSSYRKLTEYWLGAYTVVSVTLHSCIAE